MQGSFVFAYLCDQQGGFCHLSQFDLLYLKALSGFRGREFESRFPLNVRKAVQVTAFFVGRLFSAVALFETVAVDDGHVIRKFLEGLFEHFRVGIVFPEHAQCA